MAVLNLVYNGGTDLGPTMAAQKCRLRLCGACSGPSTRWPYALVPSPISPYYLSLYPPTMRWYLTPVSHYYLALYPLTMR
eukprot:183177-Rhodomonas_salina.1